MTPIKLAIVVPCYNEEAVLPLSAKELLAILDRLIEDGKIAHDSFILCCDDGSKDATWAVINSLHRKDNRIKGIALAHNRGHQNALLAGLMSVRVKCDAAVSIDADLQDDPAAIIEMVDKFISGKEIEIGRAHV